jgi:hypothetical protein
MMRTLGILLFLMPALVAPHSGAQTLTSYTTFGEPGDTYNTSSAWLVNGSANPPEPFVGEAFAFTATTSGYLSQLNLAISAGNGNLASDLANISITLNNSANLPGTALESFHNVACPGPFGADNPITSLTSIVNPLLQSGNTYWLCVQPALSTADISVNENSLGVLARQAQEFSPSAWTARGTRSTFAFEVDVSEVPEPSAAALAALGILVLIRPLARRFHINCCKTKVGKFLLI